MSMQLNLQPMRNMVQGFIKINQDVLNIPDLSSEQRTNLMKLANELNILEREVDESKIKFQLPHIFNRLD
jgi:hypothetical protein